MDLPNHDNGHCDYDYDDDDDDEFFGSQEDDFQPDGTAAPFREFGNMSRHEIHAKHNELKNIGFLEAYDESKESRLQEGFERGFLDSFEAGKAIGSILGRATTRQIICEKDARGKPKDPVSSEGGGASRSTAGIAALIHDYFATEFQKDLDSNNGIKGLETLVSKAENYPAADD
mmetsp:Transcript_26541/g.72940  ORF Transcript_26541/g.72940 Transcript_26541/m.72940 type:complete len:174 (+) Transcript_26541:181-702(+)|eukprot:CAMPEP_0172358610 /NCGR_PEP_ID=MMETSP1060-20121228/2914_1 /TAXON_ID=37318 /ORGANISM="Pseudo-nitzschia pungens, Strain cf. cingulata" /LENGTH=173 /DNA_ID=CAMNT_0013079905 /DNA_START=87 /DNA_END=608 /DNA_ORIENTATION=+